MPAESSPLLHLEQLGRKRELLHVLACEQPVAALRFLSLLGNNCLQSASECNPLQPLPSLGAIPASLLSEASPKRPSQRNKVAARAHSSPQPARRAHLYPCNPTEPAKSLVCCALQAYNSCANSKETSHVLNTAGRPA